MNEKSPNDYPFRVGSDIASSGAPEARRTSKTIGVAQEWERILWSKTAPALQKPVEQARPFGQNEHTPGPIKWLRVFWARRWGKHKADRIRSDIRETSGNMTSFMTMAQYAINLAVQSEPRIEVQTAKRRELMDRWRNTYERVFSRGIRF